MLLSYNYAQYVSIVDIIIIVLVLLAIIVGIKVGFMRNFINIASFFMGLIFAIFFASTFAKNCLYPTFGASIEQSFYNNIIENPTIAGLSTTDGLVEALESTGIPGFIARSVAANVNPESIPESIATNLSSALTNVTLTIISFFALWLGTSLLCLILKLFVKILRRNVVIRVVDSVLGVIFLNLIVYVLVEVVFLFFMLIARGNDGLNQFIINDMSTDMSPFRISGWLYNNNILGNFFSLFF